jgi:hypothetical protein
VSAKAPVTPPPLFSVGNTVRFSIARSLLFFGTQQSKELGVLSDELPTINAQPLELNTCRSSTRIFGRDEKEIS